MEHGKLMVIHNHNMNIATEHPTFSLLMSVYKNEQPLFLKASLDSIVAQTIQPNQVVIVKDGPLTPELEAVLESYHQIWGERYKLISLPSNRGLGAALNEGTKYVTSEWIARMDSDDIAVSNRFEIQLDVIRNHPEVALIGGQVDEFNFDPTKTIGRRAVPQTNNDIRAFLKLRNPFNHPTVMVKKTVLVSVGGYQPDGKIEDYFLWTRILAQDQVGINVPQVLVPMRVGSGMYGRRGDWGNLNHFFKLRNFMKKNGMINQREKMVGDVMQLGNLIVPESIRKIIYTKILHK